MLPLNRRSKEMRHDPAPSRWSWRMQRLMLTPGIRLGLRAAVPFCLTAGVALWLLNDEGKRAALDQMVAEARASIEQRPEFTVKMMAIDGVEPKLAAQIREVFPLDFPLSSFDLDLDAMRQRITQIPTIRAASVRVRPGGVLQIDAQPRVPVVLWRSADGLIAIDAQGTFVADVARRDFRADLPLIAGDGARALVPEALTLLEAAAPLGARLRGLVRVGARRWDVVLDRDQRILLPETQPLRALERVIALENAQEVLTRDVVIVDLRLPDRPTVRMNTGATTEWRSVQDLTGELSENR